MVDPFVQTFPGLLSGGYQKTSAPSRRYNCIAWAAGDSSNWWWPVPSDSFWPSGIDRIESLVAFRELFASLGYRECADEVLDAAHERVALFANDRDDVLHAARQLPSGRWTSKLGELEDIEHELRDLEGAEYGRVVLIMSRSRA